MVMAATWAVQQSQTSQSQLKLTRRMHLDRQSMRMATIWVSCVQPAGQRFAAPRGLRIHQQAQAHMPHNTHVMHNVQWF
jgi:hypothetical protein